MSTAEFPGGMIEETHGAALADVLRKAREQFERGATKVVIYPEPHAVTGDGRRCTTCGGLRDDDRVHLGARPPAGPP